MGVNSVASFRWASIPLLHFRPLGVISVASSRPSGVISVARRVRPHARRLIPLNADWSSAALVWVPDRLPAPRLCKLLVHKRPVEVERYLLSAA
eukprot:87513-Rhodomonas_salina.1